MHFKLVWSTWTVEVIGKSERIAFEIGGDLKIRDASGRKGGQHALKHPLDQRWRIVLKHDQRINEIDSREGHKILWVIKEKPLDILRTRVVQYLLRNSEVSG
jgi:hypothetical protein